MRGVSLNCGYSKAQERKTAKHAKVAKKKGAISWRPWRLLFEKTRKRSATPPDPAPSSSAFSPQRDAQPQRNRGADRVHPRERNLERRGERHGEDPQRHQDDEEQFEGVSPELKSSFEEELSLIHI